MATKPIAIILGIVHSKVAEYVAPHLLDETLSKFVKPVLDKIDEGIRDLKIKDLKLSQDQLQFIMIRLQNKFANHKGSPLPESSKEALTQEIESDLKSTQKSALSALNSGLGSVEQVDCIKIILMTECFLVLNTLSLLHEIKPHEKGLLLMKLKNAESSCNIKLRQLNELTEVCDYITKKLLIEGKGTIKLTVDNRRFGIGIDKSKLAKEVITINFYVHMFFQHFRNKLADLEAEELPKKKKKKKMEDENEEDDDGFEKDEQSTGLGILTSAIAPTNDDVLLLNHDVLSIGAAVSVILRCKKLAQHVVNYMLSFDDIARMNQMEQVKKFLHENKGVQMRKTKVNKKQKKEQSNDTKDVRGASPLKYLTMLSQMTTMDDYIAQLAMKERVPSCSERFRNMAFRTRKNPALLENEEKLMVGKSTKSKEKLKGKDKTKESPSPIEKENPQDKERTTDQTDTNKDYLQGGDRNTKNMENQRDKTAMRHKEPLDEKDNPKESLEDGEETKELQTSHYKLNDEGESQKYKETSEGKEE